MSTALSLAMQISANTAGLASAVRDVEKKLDALAKSAEKTTNKLSGLKVLADIGAVGFGVSAIINTFSRGYGAVKGFAEAASSTSQEMAKVGQVFGEAAGYVENFSESTTKIGISSTQALQASASFGNLFTALGSSREEAAKMSTEMVTLAADLAAFNNTSTQEALNALSSGLRGEQEPLKRYGLILSDSVLKLKAFEQGMIETRTQALTPLQRAQLAYQVAMEQTKNAQGQALREASTYGGVMRALAATFDNLKGTIGQAVIPLLKQVGSAMLEVAPSIEQVAREFVAAAEDLDISGIVQGLVKAMASLVKVFVKVAAVVIPVLNLALRPLGAVFELIGKNTKVFAYVAGGAVLALGAWKVYAIATTIANYALATSIKSILASTGIGVLVTALGVGAMALLDWATSSNEVTASTIDTEAQTAQMRAEFEALNNEFQRSNSEMSKLTENGKRVREAFSFKIGEITSESIAQTAVNSFRSGFESVVQEMGALNAVPKELQVAWKRINGLIQAYNDGQANSATDLERINREARIYLDLVEKQKKALDEQAKAQKAIAEASKKASETVTGLIQEGQSPSDKAKEKYLADMKAIQRFISDEEKRLNEVWRTANAQQQQQAMARYNKAQEIARQAQSQATANYKDQELAARGIEESLYEVAETTSSQIASVMQAYRDKLLTAEQARRALGSLAQEGIKIREDLNRELSTTSITPLQFKDARSEEGLKEYFRLASGQDDPAIEQRREQLQKLAEIERALRENGVRPVDILGATA